jgi:hypothetical protein
MKIDELKRVLVANGDRAVRFKLPDGSLIPAHAHVTEAARIDKRFVDCGGTFREESLCRLQTWVANDLEHRLTSGKLLKILETAKAVLISDELEMDVEHEVGYISQFPLEKVSVSENEVRLELATRHTACLALDQCCPKPAEIAGFPKLNFPLPPSLLKPLEGSKADCCR